MLTWVVFSNIFGILNPKLGEDEAILTSIFFQMGWFNYQVATFLVDFYGVGESLGNPSISRIT